MRDERAPQVREGYHIVMFNTFAPTLPTANYGRFHLYADMDANGFLTEDETSTWARQLHSTTNNWRVQAELTRMFAPGNLSADAYDFMANDFTTDLMAGSVLLNNFEGFRNSHADAGALGQSGVSLLDIYSVATQGGNMAQLSGHEVALAGLTNHLY
jgi:hypothetical protein